MLVTNDKNKFNFNIKFYAFVKILIFFRHDSCSLIMLNDLQSDFNAGYKSACLLVNERIFLIDGFLEVQSFEGNDALLFEVVCRLVEGFFVLKSSESRYVNAIEIGGLQNV